jgi:hypothetical protein
MTYEKQKWIIRLFVATILSYALLLVGNALEQDWIRWVGIVTYFYSWYAMWKWGTAC